MSACRSALHELMAGRELTTASADLAMTEVLEGSCSPTLTAAWLTALARRPETAEELTGFARAVRRKATELPAASHALCPCGTGGSGLQTANTSTAVAFVLAAAGVPVAKHGNRASSGLCGSADVLERLSIAVDIPVERSGQLLAELGLCFLFAPRVHPALRQLAPLRRELGFATVFNFLGPLCNPAGVQHQLLGVSDSRRALPMVQALRNLGSSEVLAVTGLDGLDELSLTGPSQVIRLHNGALTTEQWTPEQAGLERREPEALRGGDASVNAVILLKVLNGEACAAADLTALNAGAALLLTGHSPDLASGVAKARGVLASGAARDLLERYRRACSIEKSIG